jgi:hypothetical protein
VSTQDPGPSDRPEVEYLSEEEAARPRSGSGRKRALVAVGAVALLGLGGAAAYGVMQFMSSGDSAATAVPANALGYLSVDLDPSGGQKVAAYETMRKFPALKEQLGLDSDEDPREWLVDAINQEAPPECKFDFEDEVEPWLGDKIALSAVEGEDEPEPFAVLEVTDSDAATEAIDKLFSCGNGEAEEHGTAMVGDFMVVAPTGEVADQVAADAEESPLADDETFQARMSDAGDAGIMTGYLAPAAVDLMLEEAEGGGGDPTSDASPGAFPTDEPGFEGTEDMEGMESTDEFGETEGMDDFAAEEPMGPDAGMVPPVGDEQVEVAREYFEDFEGAAMQLRFAGEGLELEMVAAGIKGMEDYEAGTTGMGDLPDSTAIAFGMAAGPEVVDAMEDAIKGQMSDEEYESQVEQMEQETGLDLPEDVKTLLGEGLSVAVDSSIDVEALGQAFGSGQTDGLDIPMGIRIVSDDTDAVVEVTDKLKALLPPDMPVTLEVEEGDGAVAIGVDADYVAELAGEGGLGDTDAYEDAVPGSDDSAGAVYVDFDAENWLDEMVGEEDPETSENVEPLSSMGMSGSVEGDTARMLMRLTTD